MLKLLLRVITVSLSVALLVPLLAGCVTQKAPPIKNIYNVLSAGVDKSGKKDVSEAVATAAEECKNQNAVLYFPKGRYKVSEMVVIPRNVSVYVAEGAVFDIAEDAELSIKSLVFEAPNEKIFTGTGSVSGFSPYVSVRPEWFGGKADDGKDDSEAIKKAIYAAGGSIYLSEGTYNIDTPVDFEELGAKSGNAIAIRGAAKGKTVIKIADGVTAFENKNAGVGVSSYFFEDLVFEGNGTGEAIYLMHQVYIANCTFKNLTRGLYANKAGMSSFLYNKAEGVSESVFEIGDDTMFIYFYGNYAESCGTLVKVRGGGAVCTGVQITNCQTKNMTGYDIDLFAAGGDTNFVDGCRFEGGTGKAFIRIAQVLYPHISENEIIGANNGKSGVIFEGDTHSAVVNQNMISGTENAVIIAGSSHGSVSENFLKDNVCDVALYSANGYSVHSNWLYSDTPVKMLGQNHRISIANNSYKKDGAAHLANYADDFMTVENNKLDTAEPSRERILTGEKSIDTEFIQRVEISARLPRNSKNTVSVADKMADGTTFADALKSAISSLSNGGTVIVDAGKYSLDDSVTIPENIVLAVLPNAKITVAKGKTLEILSSDVSYLTPMEIFDGSVKMANAKYILSEWFGALNGSSAKDSAPAVEKAIATGASTLRFARGSYLFATSVDIPAGTKIEMLGEGHNITKLNASGDITVFSAQNVSENDSFSIAAISGDGDSKSASFIDYVAKEPNTVAYLKAGDFFGNNYNYLIKTENISGRVEIADFYIGNVNNGYFINATDNVYGLRSLTVGMSEHTVYIDGKKPDGSRSKNHVYVNFCSVMSQKNLVMKNVEDVLYSAAGYDSAVGKFDATLTFENVKDGIFETTFITSANKHGVIIRECENFTLLGNELHTLLNAVVVENSKNVVLQDNWYYNSNGISNQIINSENVTVIGNPVVVVNGESTAFISNEGSKNISLIANVYNGKLTVIDYTDAEINGVGNFEKDITATKVTEPERLSLSDFLALIPTASGDTVDDSRAGVVYKQNGAVVIDNSTGCWFGNAGITSKDPLSVTELSTKVTMLRDVYVEATVSRSFTLELSKESPTKINSGSTDSRNNLSLIFYFTENGAAMRIKGKGSLKSAEYETKDITVYSGNPESVALDISLKTNGNDLDVTVNGVTETVKNGAKLLGNTAYLSYITQCYGAAAMDVEIHSLNGEEIK